MKLSIEDRRLLDYYDSFRVVLIDAAGDTILPELMEVFGKEDMIKFLEIFAGMVVAVPSVSIIENSVKAVSIYHMMGLNPTEEIVSDVAVRYDMRRENVWSTYNRVKKLVSEVYGVEEKKNRKAKDQKDPS